MLNRPKASSTPSPRLSPFFLAMSLCALALAGVAVMVYLRSAQPLREPPANDNETVPAPTWWQQFQRLSDDHLRIATVVFISIGVLWAARSMDR